MKMLPPSFLTNLLAIVRTFFEYFRITSMTNKMLLKWLAKIQQIISHQSKRAKSQVQNTEQTKPKCELTLRNVCGKCEIYTSTMFAVQNRPNH